MTIRNAIGAAVLAALMIFMVSHSDASRAWEVCLDQACKDARAAAAAPATGTATVAVTPAAAPADFKSLLDKLINVDAPAAIAKAQAIVDANKDPVQVQYAQARINCYQTIVAIAPNFALLSLPTPSKPAGVLDAFETVAEGAEAVSSAVQVGLPKADEARFTVACGWIGQRAAVIAGTLGLRVAAIGANAAALVPK